MVRVVAGLNGHGCTLQDGKSPEQRISRPSQDQVGAALQGWTIGQDKRLVDLSGADLSQPHHLQHHGRRDAGGQCRAQGPRTGRAELAGEGRVVEVQSETAEARHGQVLINGQTADTSGTNRT